MNNHNVWMDGDWVERSLLMATTELRGALTQRKIRAVMRVLKQHPNEDGKIVLENGEYGWRKL